MSKLPIALATLAIATVSAIPLSTEADAGRGFRGGHFRFHHIHVGPPIYHRHEEPVRVYRKPRVVRPAAAPAPVVKFADGEGRMFDRASSTWFDGAGSCWKGDKSFAYRGGAWFYGNARWVQTSNGWGVSSGQIPEQVDCASVKAFAGKIKPVASGPETSPAEPAKPVAAVPVEAVKPGAAKEVATRTIAPTESKAPEATANASDCKKYFPSLGEAISVPCGQ